MASDRNHDEATATTVRSSILLPEWMDRRVTEISARTFSSRSQVIRQMVAEALEREDAKRMRVLA